MRVILLFILSAFSINCFSQNADIDLLRKINLNRNKNLDGTFKFITDQAGTVAFGTPIVVIGSGLLMNDSATKAKGYVVGASLIVASGISSIMKWSINRERPFNKYTDIEKKTSGGSPSFPSGHTSMAFLTATSLSLVYPKWYVIVPSFLWASSVGYSRMHLGVHYPSDVAVGALVGAGSAFFCYKAQKWLTKKR